MNKGFAVSPGSSSYFRRVLNGAFFLRSLQVEDRPVLSTSTDFCAVGTQLAHNLGLTFYSEFLPRIKAFHCGTIHPLFKTSPSRKQIFIDAQVLDSECERDTIIIYSPRRFGGRVEAAVMQPRCFREEETIHPHQMESGSRLRFHDVAGGYLILLDLRQRFPVQAGRILNGQHLWR